MGWCEFATAGFSVCPVSGGHTDMFKEPHAAGLAAAVARALD
jgi:hypothetical protein